MENEKKKITKRIGSFTFGIMMILIGVTILLQTITNLDLFRFALSLWPVVFILLGLETLYYSYKKEVEVKYDIGSVIIIFIVLFFSFVFSGLNYGINKVLYDKGIKSDIAYYLTNTDCIYNFENKVKINNISGKEVVVKFVEDKEADNVTVKTKLKYNESYEGSIIRILKERESLNKILDINYDTQELIINNLPDSLSSLEITVTANDKSMLTYNGNVVY